jgi:hypothetical protein
LKIRELNRADSELTEILTQEDPRKGGSNAS